MRDRQTEIKNKGFNMLQGNPITKSEYEAQFGKDSIPEDFSKIRVGLKTLDDAVMNLGIYRKINHNYGDKAFILNAIDKHDYETLREVSKYFYEASGIYQRMCKYLALLYKYDWFVTTSFTNNTRMKESKKVLNDFMRALDYLDNSDIKRLFGNIALEVIKCGSYYGYILEFNDKFSIQQLPAKYCRSRFNRGIDPVVELHMSFFNAYFPDPQYRIRVLKMFPKEIQKAYVDYEENRLKGDYPGDSMGWTMLDPDCTVKFNLGDNDFPVLVGAIPSIIDLDQAQELDRKKTMQQLLKIVIQKLPLDKNGDLVFDVDEAKDIHNNAVAMLRRAVGVDVLTTFADIDVADMQDSNSTTKTDDLEKVERTVYNNLGVSQNLFNTDGNLSLEKSIANDEAVMRDLIYQYQNLLNRIIKKFNKNSYNFKVCILETTIYNYKDLSKMYKEQTQIGYSKMLPQIALGHSQSSILASIQFENDILKLSDIMIPPMMSSTMSSKNLNNNNNNSNSNNNTQVKQQQQEAEVGRPEKTDDQKSDKTIANRAAMG